MKKHKKIGVVIIALFMVVALGVTGVFWYKNHVYIGVDDVKAKLDEPFTCADGSIVNLKASDDGSNIWTVTGPSKPYNVDIYVGTQAIASDIQAEAEAAKGSDNAQVKTMGQWVAERPGDFANNGQPIDTLSFSGGTHEFNTTNYLNTWRAVDPGYSLIISLWIEGQQEAHNDKGEVILDKNQQVVMSNYYCGYRGIEEIGGEIGNEPNPYREICEQWANADEPFEIDGVKLNTHVNEYKEWGVYDLYKQYKQSKIEELCPTGSPDPNKANVLTSIETTDLLYYSDAKIKRANASNTNASIGDPSDYEAVQDRKIGTLYCKTNSVYLRDVDNENSLEKSDQSNQFAMNYKGDPSFKESTKAGNVLPSDAGKPNLFLFKYTAEAVKKSYHTVVSDGKGGWTDNGGTDIDVCSVECTEYLKVNFDPPQEVTAGTCFSYAVQVIAYTQCEANVTGNPPVKEKPTALRPRCHDGESIGAGPQEEFDSCVNSCDGGKYTTECSLQCLNKVYGDSASDIVIGDGKSKTKKVINKQLTANSTVIPDFMTSSREDEHGEIIPGPDADQCPSVTTPAAQKDSVRAWFRTHTSGYFYYNESQHRIYFKSYYPGCYWAQYAPYYYLNDWGWETMSTHDMHWNTGSGCTDHSNCEPQAPSCTTAEGACAIGEGGQNGGGGYLVDVNVSNASCSKTSETPYCENTCDTTCWFDSTDGVGNVTSDAAATAVYNENARRYREALDGCSAVASCRTTEAGTKSTFVIGVNGEKEWKATNDTGNTDKPTSDSSSVCPPEEGDSLIIQGKTSTGETRTPGTGGLCYCGNKDYNGWHHYTRWTFPGTWVDEKMNVMTHTPPSADEKDYYTGGYNLYCTPYDAESVNDQWAKEYLKKKDELKDDLESRKAIQFSDNINWNITARTENFGNYGWTIDTACFYSVVRDICDENDPNWNPETQDCGENENEDPGRDNVKTKVADPENLIPGEGSKEKKESFNWSDAATKLDIETKDGYTYEIVPGAYKKYAEETVGDNVFNKEYLDYEFTFTGDDLKEISNESGSGYKFGNYSNGTHEALIDENNCSNTDASKKCDKTFTMYFSDWLRRLNYTRIPSKSAALKCNNLDSSGGNANSCADTTNIIPATDYVQCFKKNKEARKANPNAEVLDCE